MSKLAVERMNALINVNSFSCFSLMTREEFVQLSKTVSHALRHEPKYYNLQLDDQGWILLADLVAALNLTGIKVDEKIVIEMVNQSDKKRHQIHEGKIRAYYGHSLERKIIKQPLEPPDFLFHGTIKTYINNIQEEGLLPMDRQYVHLLNNEDTAKINGSRRQGELVILKVKAKEAHTNHIQFYKEGNGIWLAEPISSKYIIFS